MGTLFVCLAASAAFAASNETVLHSFRPAQMDTAPGLVVDARGNLYGSAGFGGVGCGTATDGCGVIFKLIAQGGQWHYQVLYSFQGGSDGSGPNAVMLDAAGNIYGTTYWGGDLSCGTAFKLAPNSDGTWTFGTIHEFKGSPNGCHPVGRFVLDSAGNLYGVTGNGGILFGTVFQLTPSAAGWRNYYDGAYPSTGLTLDAAGNLYGTTIEGGNNNDCFGGCGVVFELIYASGIWTETVLHRFNYFTEGAMPLSTLALDAAGNIYGTNFLGGTGAVGGGTAFRLAPNGSGGWTFTLLHTFNDNSLTSDGCFPSGDLVLDSQGNLYGTTGGGGAFQNGEVYELIANSGTGPWAEQRVYSFAGGVDGSAPVAGVIRDTLGNFFGTTEIGGAFGSGTAFEVKPIQ